MMQWQSGLLVSVFFAAVITLGLTVYAWRHREASGAPAFAAMMLIVTLWSLITGARLMFSATLEGAYFWQILSYACIAAVPVAYLAFAFQYTGRGHWLNRPRLGLLCIVPLVTQIIAWTNGSHGLFMRKLIYYYEGDMWIPGDRITGPWFWVHTTYSYALLVFCMSLIVLAAIRSFELYRMQAIAWLAGTLVPLALNLYITFWPTSVGIANYGMPLTFTLMGLVYSWAIFRYRLLDLAPIARSQLVEIMGDGMLALDARNRIVDLNPAMQAIMHIPAAQVVIGQPAGEALRSWHSLIERFQSDAQMQSEFTLGQGEALRYYDLLISPLTDQQSRVTGKLVLLHDITARKKAEQAEQAALQREMHLARNIQMSLLPQTMLAIPGIDITGVFIPAREVGGDWYACYALPPNEQNPRGGYAITVGDVSGKGIPAALYMAGFDHHAGSQSAVCARCGAIAGADQCRAVSLYGSQSHEHSTVLHSPRTSGGRIIALHCAHCQRRLGRARLAARRSV
jgi:PAS domain-containing protein